MGELAHPNLAQLHAAFLRGGELWIVLQLHACGSCADLLANARPAGFEEDISLHIVREAAKGLAYLHDHATLHRNLRASNLLVGGDGCVRVADLGLSGRLHDGGERRSRAGTFVGSPGWMAPEVLEQANGYGRAADVWSLGITAIELATGMAPYAKLPPLKVLLQVLQAPPPQLPTSASAPFRLLVDSCLCFTPEERPSAGSLHDHPAFSTFGAR